MKKKRRLGFLFATRDDIDDQNWLAEPRNFEWNLDVLTNSKLFLPNCSLENILEQGLTSL